MDVDSRARISVIVPVGKRCAEIARLYAEYKSGLDALREAYECIFVLDGPRPAAERDLERLGAEGERITIVSLTRPFGEATALMAGFGQASGEVIVTLPAYFQIQGSEIAPLVDALESADIAIGRRWPRRGGSFETWRRNLFHGLLAWVTGQRYHDLGCGARAMKRRVLEEVSVYGDQHRFLAVLADRQGFRVREVDVQQSPLDHFEGVYRAREYAHRALDLFTVFFLVRFTKKPLRFFGMIGAALFGIGSLLVTYVVIERLFFGVALADRPALLLSSLLVVLGLQVFALGLLGELIIFTHARGIKDYQIDRIIQYADESRDASVTPEHLKTAAR